MEQPNKTEKKINGKVYAIRSHQTEKLYIGSTTQTLCKRFGDHVYNYKKFLKNSDSGMSSVELMKYDDTYIELISEHNDITKDMLRKFEGEEIRKNKENCVNIYIAGRTIQQYRKDNPDVIKTQRIREYQKNSDKIKARVNKYRLDNLDVIKERKTQTKTSARSVLVHSAAQKDGQRTGTALKRDGSNGAFLVARRSRARIALGVSRDDANSA